MTARWDDLFDRGAAYDGDLERIRSELEALRQTRDDDAGS